MTLNIIACDSCNNTNPATYYKSQIVFQFGRGYLAKASPPQIEDVIAQGFSVDEISNQQNGGDAGQENQGQGGQGGGGQGVGGQAANEAPEQTQNIQTGQTIDWVGQPQKAVNLGPKQI